MKLVELAFFTDQVSEMAAFYQRLLGSEAVAQSEDMAIFMVGHTKIFIHKNYTPGEGDLPADNHMAFEVEDLDAACGELIKRGPDPGSAANRLLLGSVSLPAGPGWADGGGLSEGGGVGRRGIQVDK